MSKKIFMISGPNGAGKTTTVMSLIPNYSAIYEFINADEIARGLAPLHPESVSLSASKLMLNRFKDLLDSGKNVAFETTGASTNYVKHLKESQLKGYEVHLVFLWLTSPELAIQRVIHRVSQGGHHIPEETVRRRYYSGLINLIKHYLPISDNAIILDNSSSELNKVIATKDKIEDLRIYEQKIWEEIQDIACLRKKMT